MTRRAKHLAFGLAVVALVGLAAAWWMAMARRTPDAGTAAALRAHGTASSPPAPVNLEALDPGILARLRPAMAAVRQRPGDPKSWRALGLVYDANEIFGPAAECYERVVTLRPADGRCWYDLAVVRAELGEVDGAIEAMRLAIAIDPDYAPQHWRLGFWLLDRGELEEARASFKAATRIDGRDEAGWIGLARTHLQDGSDDEAIDILQRIADNRSANEAYARSLLARAYRRLGRNSEADAASLGGLGARLVTIDPWRDEVARDRAGLTSRIREAGALVAAGRRDEAVAMMEQLAGEHPDEVSILTALGTTYSSVGDLPRSVQTLRQAVARRPSYYPAHLGLARAMAAMSDADGQDAAALRAGAMEHVDRALELNPTLSAAHGLRGEMLMASGEFAAAAESFAAAARGEPANPQWRYRAAVAHGRAGQWQAAAEQLAVLAQWEPDSAPVLMMLGVALTNVGDLDGAEAALRRAVELAPTDPALDDALRELRRRRAEP